MAQNNQHFEWDNFRQSLDHKHTHFRLGRGLIIGLNPDYLCLDQDENVYVYGLTIGGNYPIQNAGYSVPKSGQFIHSLDKTLTKTNFSTTFGTGKSSPDIVPTAFLVNECGNIYISGWGGKVNNNIANAPQVNTTGMPVRSEERRVGKEC